MPLRKLRIITIIVLGLFLSFTYTYYLYTKAREQKSLPVLGQVYDFDLTDTQGKNFSLKELQGNIWTANFFFTTCGDICPIMSKNMAALHRSFELLDNVQHVSITVNPEYDSPSVLTQYADKYKANQSKWHFLTGSREQIKDLAVKSFKLGSIEEPVFHSSQFALVDGNGYIRGYYDGLEASEVSQLFQDVALLNKGQ